MSHTMYMNIWIDDKVFLKRTPKFNITFIFKYSCFRRLKWIKQVAVSNKMTTGKANWFKLNITLQSNLAIIPFSPAWFKVHNDAIINSNTNILYQLVIIRWNGLFQCTLNYEKIWRTLNKLFNDDSTIIYLSVELFC